MDRRAKAWWLWCTFRVRVHPDYIRPASLVRDQSVFSESGGSILNDSWKYCWSSSLCCLLHKYTVQAMSCSDVVTPEQNHVKHQAQSMHLFSFFHLFSSEEAALHTPPEWDRVTKSETRVVYYILSGTPRSRWKYIWLNLTADFFRDNPLFLICDQMTNQTYQLIGLMYLW